MKSRTNGIARAVLGLLESDMHGEFRKGDTIGFWTYDERIHADLPMLVWTKENKESVTEDVMRYLRHQKYDGKAHLEKVLNTVGRVLQQSERLTVILIHDGSDPIHGTEFDSDINELQKKYAREFRSQHLPIVTVLVARGSIVYDYTINYPDSISIPHTAFPEPPPETNKPPVPAIAAVPVAPVVPAPPPRHIEIIMAGTNHLTHELSSAELAALAAPAPSDNPVSVTAPQSQPPPADSTTASTPAPAPVANDSQQANQASSEAVETKSEPVAPSPVAAQSASAPISVTSPAPPVAAAAVTTTSTTTPSPSSQPKSTETTTQASTPVPTPTVAAIPAREAHPASLSNKSASDSDTASITDTPVARQAALSIIAISLLTIAVVLVIFLVRHLRAGTPSLISQSMDRGR